MSSPECMRTNPGKVKKRLAGGVGMSELLDESTLEHIVTMGRSGTSDDDVAAAPIELNTMVFAEPGKTIKGDDIYNLIQAAKAENVTITSKLHQLKDVSIQT